MNTEFEFINDSEDMEWLLTVHLPLVDRGFLKGSAILVGNEDTPDQIRLYPNKNPKYTEKARVYEYSPNYDTYFYVWDKVI